MDFLRDPIWTFLGVLTVVILTVIPLVYRAIQRREKSIKADVEFLVTDYSCAFGMTVGHNLPGNDVFVDDGFHLDVSGHFDVSVNNPEFSDAYVYVHSIQTNWEIDLSEAAKRSEVKIEVPKPDYVSENPIVLGGRNTIPKCRFSVVIPIRVPQAQQRKNPPFRFIGLLARLEVIIGISLKGGKKVLLPPFNPNISEFHKHVESQLIQLIVLQAKQIDGVVPNAIFALRDLWYGILTRDESRAT